MDEITDRNQPVGHRLSLTCGSCIRAGQRGSRAGDPCPGRGW